MCGDEGSFYDYSSSRIEKRAHQAGRLGDANTGRGATIVLENGKAGEITRPGAHDAKKWHR